jgi:two-component system phosphate regulon sensor histidine kinase PhoR
MNIRGIGDVHGFRRLTWLFLTTIVAPSALLVLLAVGAFGQRLWSEHELAYREVEVQLPHVAARLTQHAVDLQTGLYTCLDACAPDCPAHACERAGIAAWSAAGRSWTPDREQLAREAEAMLLHDPAWNGAIELASAPPGVALGAPLTGMYLRDVRAPRSGVLGDRTLSITVPLLLLTLVLIGVTTGLRAAAREISMSRRQTELVSRISHELRTPLTSIRMFVDTLREGRLPPERTQECLDLMSEESARLSRRIEQVLRWARMEAGARRYRLDAVPPAEIADEAVAAFRSQVMMEESAPDLIIDVPTDLPPIMADRDAVVEALVNLLVNAFRHSTVPRHIQLRAVSRGLQVGLSVQDNGPGIRSSEQRRIFEKFYQPEDGANTATDGSGLGLAIVRAIVRDHGGRVQLESEPQRGSRFTLWLPTAWSRGYTGAAVTRAAEDL